MFEMDYVEAVPPRRAPLPVRVSRQSQLITALRQRVRPIVIEDQELACPFARLLRARELQVWAPGAFTHQCEHLIHSLDIDLARSGQNASLRFKVECESKLSVCLSKTCSFD